MNVKKKTMHRSSKRSSKLKLSPLYAMTKLLYCCNVSYFLRCRKHKKCAARKKTSSHYILTLLVSCIWLLLIYSLLHRYHLHLHPEPPHMETPDIDSTHVIITRPSDAHRHRPVFSNIGIVVPALMNEFTAQYLNRLLHNVYCAQLQHEPISQVAQVYYPSELIISMSVMPPHYAHLPDVHGAIEHYTRHYLSNDTSRLRLFIHRNQSLNAAMNRNFGVAQINANRSQFVSLFDIDDIMHPQRVAILHQILNHNPHIDLLMHAFLIHKTCRLDHVDADHWQVFERNQASVMDDDDLQMLASDFRSKGSKDLRVLGVPGVEYYASHECVAYYKPDAKRKPASSRFQVECLNEDKKETLRQMQQQNLFAEWLTFNRWDHTKLANVFFVDFSDLIRRRCATLETVRHPIEGRYYDVDCGYGTMAGGLEPFRNEKSVTRHHNGWPTMKTAIAKRIRYDEAWSLHGSYRGQDSAFNLEVHAQNYTVYHLGYYLGMYCYH